MVMVMVMVMMMMMMMRMERLKQGEAFHVPLITEKAHRDLQASLPLTVTPSVELLECFGIA